RSGAGPVRRRRRTATARSRFWRSLRGTTVAMARHTVAGSRATGGTAPGPVSVTGREPASPDPVTLFHLRSGKAHVSDLLWLGFALAERSSSLLLAGQAVAAFDQFFQPLGETCRLGAIDHVVIKADRQAQVFADGDLPVDHPRLFADAAHRHPAQ